MLHHTSVVSNFNSIKVRLDQSTLMKRLHTILYFNSIKVRLDQAQHRKLSDADEFQFHKGTIRPVRQAKLNRQLDHFNSIKVRLDQLSVIWFIWCNWHFNSIKVRLDHSLCVDVCRNSEFQFHKGTIRPKSCKSKMTLDAISIP